jgi:predicted phage tail protein
MLKTIKFYGPLKDFLGYEKLEAHVNSVGQTMRFLITNFPELEKHMAEKSYKILINEDQIDETQIMDPIGQATIHIVPVLTGAGGNFGRILTGAALIGASFLFPGAGMFGTYGLGGAAAVKGGILTGIGTLTSAVGAAMVLGGVSDMLFPKPKMPEFSSPNDPRISFGFSGTQNTSRAGTPVPLVYGEIFTGSVVISAGVDTHQVSA